MLHPCGLKHIHSNCGKLCQDQQSLQAHLDQFGREEIKRARGRTEQAAIVHGATTNLGMNLSRYSRISDATGKIYRMPKTVLDGGGLTARTTTTATNKPTTVEELKVAAGSFGVPTMANLIEGGKTPFLSAAELEELGFSIAAYPHSLILTCIRSIQRTLSEIKEKGTTKGLLDTMADFSELDELIGFPEAREWEARFTPRTSAGQ